MDLKDFCVKRYKEIYQNETKGASKVTPIVERAAQKKAIRETVLEALEKYENVDGQLIRQHICVAHVHRKSGLSDIKVIAAVDSAIQSWKKSSGHAFEEAVEILLNRALKNTGMKAYLQREISDLLSKEKFGNGPKDISWLKKHLKASNFDLFLTLQHAGKEEVFCCIQSKTSIRDRVKGDREHSDVAMNAFFWSIAFVLDGEFFALPKFQQMVNGGSATYANNGWHGCYVFSEKYTLGRIYGVDKSLKIFVDHAKQASKAWVEERTWFIHKWKPA